MGLALILDLAICVDYVQKSYLASFLLQALVIMTKWQSFVNDEVRLAEESYMHFFPWEKQKILIH